MSTKDLIDSAVDHLHTSGSIKMVFGEPVSVDGKTIIPVASSERTGDEVSAKPVGVVEISEEKTRFVPIAQKRKLALAALIGSGLGILAGVLFGRKRK